MVRYSVTEFLGSFSILNTSILLVRCLKEERSHGDVSLTHPKHMCLYTVIKKVHISKNQSLNFRGFTVIPDVNLLFRIWGARFSRKDYDKKL